MLKIAIPFKGAETKYEIALKALGADPVQVWDEADPAGFDGVLMPGGGDVDPARFGAENRGSTRIDTELDRVQFAVLDRFVRAGKPVMGICRGHQVINVYFGGTLIQDIYRAKFHAYDPVSMVFEKHGAYAEPGSLFAELYGTSFRINSAHHQACGLIGKGLRVTMRSDDGYVEALEHETLPIFSTQWHPERMCFELREPDLVDGAVILNHFLRVCGEGRKV